MKKIILIVFMFSLFAGNVSACSPMGYTSSEPTEELRGLIVHTKSGGAIFGYINRNEYIKIYTKDTGHSCGPDVTYMNKYLFIGIVALILGISYSLNKRRRNRLKNSKKSI